MLSCHSIMHVPPLIFIKDIFYLNYLIGKKNYAPGNMNHCKCFSYLFANFYCHEDELLWWWNFLKIIWQSSASQFWSGLSIQVKVVSDIFYCILQEETSSVTCWNSENLYFHTWRGKCFQRGFNFKFFQEKTAVWKRHCEKNFCLDFAVGKKIMQ